MQLAEDGGDVEAVDKEGSPAEGRVGSISIRALGCRRSSVRCRIARVSGLCMRE